MQIEFPRLLYRVPGPHKRPGGTFDHALAADVDAADELLAAGWHLTLPDAITAAAAPKPASEPPKPAAEAAQDDNAEPTREELLEKCAELGIEVDGRWGTGRLMTEVTMALRRKARNAVE